MKILQDKFEFECVNCGKKFSPAEVMYLCLDCSSQNQPGQPPKGVLKTIYNYHQLKHQNIDFEKLVENRFAHLLPVKSINSFPNLRVGQTPLYHISGFKNQQFPFELFLKDDSQNPTYSFKDRASALVSAFAKENKINTIVAASTGNAGSSLAGICASQGQRAIIVVPASAPTAKLTQIVMYGAKLVPVKGTYDDAFDLSLEATRQFGWYNRNTAFNPLTIEGKKTVSFEIFEQLSQRVPDRIFVPVGDGVIISGVYKGFEDLLNLGIIDKVPEIVAVQTEKSDNLVRNINNQNFEVVKSSTIADSISVDIPRNYWMARDYLLKYNGKWLTVSDKKIIAASKILSQNTGLFAEPAASAAFAGFLDFHKNNLIDQGSKNVILLTGSGLKDLKSVSSLVKIPEPIEPNVNNLKNLIQ